MKSYLSGMNPELRVSITGGGITGGAFTGAIGWVNWG